MTGERSFQFPLAELIDNLTIDQIKEVLLPTNRDEKGALKENNTMQRLGHDIDLLMGEKQVKLTGRSIKLVMLLAQLNLMIWLHKDTMQQEPQEYDSLLQRSLELNGLRNHIKNLLMDRFGENEPSQRKATFLDYGGGKWYSDIITSLG